MSSAKTVEDNPKLVIFPTKLLQDPEGSVSIPPVRVRWMAKHFGFTALRDPMI